MGRRTTDGMAPDMLMARKAAGKVVETHGPHTVPSPAPSWTGVLRQDPGRPRDRPGQEPNGVVVVLHA